FFNAYKGCFAQNDNLWSFCNLPNAGAPRPYDSDQFRNKLDAAVDDWEGPALWAWQFDLQADAERVENRCCNFLRGHRPVFGRASDVVRRANHRAALDAASAHNHRPAGRPMVAPASGVDLGCAAELARRHHQGRIEQATIAEIFEERGKRVVEHRPDKISIATDGAEGRRAVDVPGDFVEHRLEHVDGDVAHVALDEPPRQQAPLPETVHAVALAYLFGLLSQLERLAGSC